MGVGYIFSFQLCHLVVGECLARLTSFEGWWFQAWFLPLCCFLGQTLFYTVSLSTQLMKCGLLVTYYRGKSAMDWHPIRGGGVATFLVASRY